MSLNSALFALRRELFWFRLSLRWYLDCLLHPFTDELDLSEHWCNCFVEAGNAGLGRLDRLVRLTAMQECCGCQRPTWFLVHPVGTCVACYIDARHHDWTVRATVHDNSFCTGDGDGKMPTGLLNH
jgi:hypothetical protein